MPTKFGHSTFFESKANVPETSNKENTADEKERGDIGIESVQPEVEIGIARLSYIQPGTILFKDKTHAHVLCLSLVNCCEDIFNAIHQNQQKIKKSWPPHKLSIRSFGLYRIFT